MNDLFVRLAAYRPSEDRESFENFFTELVAYLIREDPGALREFIDAVLGESRGSAGAWSIHTQQTTHSPRPELNGLFLDLVLENSRQTIIVENKVDSDLSEQQLNNYLRVAGERPGTNVAVVTKRMQPVATQCRHELFLRQVLWSQIADRWARLGDVADYRLLSNVLELMRARDMGPFDALQMGEIQAPGYRQRLNAKLGNLIHELDRRIVEPDPFVEAAEVTRRSPFDVGGYWGIGWCAPKGRTPSGAYFWYFLGFAYDVPHWWAPKTANEGEAEATVFVGIWPGRPALERVRDTVRMYLEGLFAQEFRLEYSPDMNAMFLVRRRPLRDFLGEPDQRATILNFLTDSHARAVNTGTLLAIYEAFLQHTIPAAPDRDRDTAAPGPT